MNRKSVAGVKVFALAAAVALAVAAWAPAETDMKDHHAESDLPQGPGLAAKYAMDRGIEANPDVVFHEDFEGADLGKWGEVRKETTALTAEAADVHSGRQSCQMTATLGKDTGGSLVYWFMKNGQDKCHARFYVKFDSEMKYLHHFCQLNAGAKQWSSFGGAGKLSKGDDNFKVVIEPCGDWGRVKPPGKWDFYCYWHEMKPDGHGDYWGNIFSPEPTVIPELGKWICMEVMVKANAPDKHDGELGLWQDGKLIGHFKGISLRTTAELKINVFWLSFYVTEQTFTANKVADPPKVSKCWFDDAVVAKSYIGPMATEQPPADGKKDEKKDAGAQGPGAQRPANGGDAAAAKAAQLYRDARSAESSGLKDLGRTLYARLASEYPDSPLAAEARRRMAGN